MLSAIGQDEVLRRRVVSPRQIGSEQRGLALADRSDWQNLQHLFVAGHNVRLNRFGGPTAQVDADTFRGARQLAFVQHSHPRQAEHQQRGRAVFRQGEQRGDPLFVVVLEKVSTGTD